MRIPMKMSARKSSCMLSEIVKPLMIGFLIGAVLVGIFFGGKAVGREEILKCDMWTDCNGTIYIDCIPDVIAHENLATKIY